MTNLTVKYGISWGGPGTFKKYCVITFESDRYLGLTPFVGSRFILNTDPSNQLYFDPANSYISAKGNSDHIELTTDGSWTELNDAVNIVVNEFNSKWTTFKNNQDIGNIPADITTDLEI